MQKMSRRPRMALKKIIVNFTFFLCLAFTEAIYCDSQEWVFGDVWFKGVQKEYTAGDYNDYLELIDNIFKTPIFQQVFNEQKKNLRENLSKKSRITELVKDFEAKANALNDERNKQLLLLCKGHEEEMECKIVRNAIDNDEAVKKQPSLIVLLEKRGFFNLGKSDKSAEEFSDILLEGLYKLDIAQAFAYQNKDKSKPLSEYERDILENQKTALQMQMMDKFSAFADKHQNTIIGDETKMMIGDFPKNAASKHDWAFLKGLATRDIQPETPTQEKIGEVLRAYYIDLENLTKRTFQQAFLQK